MTVLDQILPRPESEEWPEEMPDHLSASQLSMFERCPEQYRRRYVLGMKERPGAALIWGKADHAAHEVNFRQKIESGTDLPVFEVQAAFAESFDQQTSELGDEIVWGDSSPGESKDRGVALVAAYHRIVSPTVQPLAVESKFSVEIPKVPVPVIGFVDVTTADAAIERKTSGRAMREPKPDWRIQGLLYQSVSGQPVDWHVSVKSKTPAIYTPAEHPALRLPLVERRADAAQSLVRTTVQMMLACWERFGPHQPWPGALSHPWACSWCAWKSHCAWWEGA